MKPKRRTRLNPSQMRLPLIALIDVVLFLLMYFMVAGNLADEERELSTTLSTQNASAKGSGHARAVSLLVIHAGEKGEFRLGDRVVSDRAQLVALLAQLPKEGGVIVKAQGDAPVRDTAAALQACKDAGFSRISFVAADQPKSP